MKKIHRRYEKAVNTFGYFVDKLDLETIFTDEYLRIEWMNRRARKEYKDPESFLYKQWHFHLFPAAGEEEPCDICRDVLTSNGAFSKIIDVTRDASPKILQFLAFPLNLPLWDTKKFLIILIDISDEEIAKRELLAMQSLMTQALKESGDGFFIIGKEGKIRSWNLGAEIIFGYSEKEIIASPLEKIIPLDAFDTFNVEQKTSSPGTTHRIKKFETYGLNYNGKRVAIDLTRTEVYGEKEELRGVSFFVKDVSPKRALQEQLKHFIQQFYKLNELNEHLYRSLDLQEIIRIILLAVTAESGLRFDRAFLLMMDEDGSGLTGKYALAPNPPGVDQPTKGITSQGDFFEIMLRARQGEFNHKTLSPNDVFSQYHVSAEDDLHIANYVLQRRKTLLIKNGLIVDPGKHENLKGIDQISKELQCESFVLVPLIGKQDFIGLLIADQKFCGRDILLEDVEILKAFSTQASLAFENAKLYHESQKKVEELGEAYDQLREQQEKIIRFQKLATLGEMSAKIAHEIRNPLVSMGGLAKAIADKSEKNEKINYFANTIYEQALNLENILENLLNLATPRPLQKERFSIKELIEETIQTMKEGAQCKGCEFSLNIAGDLTLMADPLKMRQVFTNLIRNAYQAAGSDGKLEIFTHLPKNEEMLEIHFRDNGPGIKEENIKRIFEPFFSTKSDGTGLGLSISSQIMHQHNGEIRVNQDIGSGADILLIFYFEEGKSQ